MRTRTPIWSFTHGGRASARWAVCPLLPPRRAGRGTLILFPATPSWPLGAHCTRPALPLPSTLPALPPTLFTGPVLRGTVPFNTDAEGLPNFPCLPRIVSAIERRVCDPPHHVSHPDVSNPERRGFPWAHTGAPQIWPKHRNKHLGFEEFTRIKETCSLSNTCL